MCKIVKVSNFCFSCIIFLMYPTIKCFYFINSCLVLNFILLINLFQILNSCLVIFLCSLFKRFNLILSEKILIEDALFSYKHTLNHFLLLLNPQKHYDLFLVDHDLLLSHQSLSSYLSWH